MSFEFLRPNCGSLFAQFGASCARAGVSLVVASLCLVRVSFAQVSAVARNYRHRANDNCQNQASSSVGACKYWLSRPLKATAASVVLMRERKSGGFGGSCCALPELALEVVVFDVDVVVVVVGGDGGGGGGVVVQRAGVSVSLFSS